MADSDVKQQVDGNVVTEHADEHKQQLAMMEQEQAQGQEQGEQHHEEQQEQEVEVASLALSDDLLIQESWRVVALATDVSAWLGVKGIYQGLSNLFRADDAAVVAVSWDHRRPMEVTVDFDEDAARRKFIHRYANRHLTLPGNNAQMLLRVVQYDGPTEEDWRLYYGRVASSPDPPADTIVIRNLPAHWFGVTAATERNEFMEPSGPIRSAFGQLAAIKDMNIEVHEPEDSHAVHSTGPAITMFDLFIQFTTYAGFNSALSALSNCVFIHASGEACACEATFDRDGYFTGAMMRKREASERVQRQQQAIKAKEAEQRLKRAKARVANMRRGLRRKVKAMRTQLEFIGSMKYPRGHPEVVSTLAVAKELMRTAFATCEMYGVTGAKDVEAFLATVQAEDEEVDVMGVSVRGKSAAAGTNTARSGASRPTTGMGSPSRTMPNTPATGRPPAEDKTAGMSVEELEEYSVKPATRAVNEARRALRACEQAADHAITVANQKLPTVAEALVQLKAFKFLEILRAHVPPIDVRGKTVFVVKDSGLLDASAEPDGDERFEAAPEAHTHPFHEPQYSRLQDRDAAGQFALDLHSAVDDRTQVLPQTPLSHTGRTEARIISTSDGVVRRDRGGTPQYRGGSPPRTAGAGAGAGAGQGQGTPGSGWRGDPRYTARSEYTDGSQAAEFNTAVDLLLTSARSIGSRALSPPKSQRQAQQQQQQQQHQQQQQDQQAMQRLPLSSRSAGQLPAITSTHNPFSVQSFMVHAAQKQPKSFTSYSRLVSRLNQIRSTFMHYQTVFHQHQDVFDNTWGTGEPVPAKEKMQSRQLLHLALPKKEYQDGLKLTEKEVPWPLSKAAARNYGSSKLLDGTDVTNAFRLPAEDPYVEEEHPFRPPTPPRAPTKTIWEPRCMTVHTLAGPYTIQDLSLLDSGRMPTECRTHQMKTRVNGAGQYVVWVEPMFDITGTSEHYHNDQFNGLVHRIARRKQARNTAHMKALPAARPPSPELYLRAKVVKSNVFCEGGTILHLVDRVMFPDEFNEDAY